MRPRLRVLVLLGALALAIPFSGCLGNPPAEDNTFADLLGQAQERPAAEPENETAAIMAAQEEAEEAARKAQEEAAAEAAATYTGPPVANLSVRGPDGTLGNNTTGMAPLTVHLELEGRIAGKAAPYWTLRERGTMDLIAEGLGAQTSLSQTFLAPGTHVIRLYLTDGRFGAIDEVTVHVEPPPPPPKLVIEETITGFWVPYGGYLPDIQTHDFTLDVPVARIIVNLTGDLQAADLDLELVAPDGRVAARHVGFNEPVGLLFPPDEPPIVCADTDFTYQMGEWILRVKPAAAIEGSYTLQVTFET